MDRIHVVGFAERINTILNWTELNFTELNQRFQGFALKKITAIVNVTAIIVTHNQHFRHGQQRPADVFVVDLLQQVILQVTDPLRVADVAPVVVWSLQDPPQHFSLPLMHTPCWWNIVSQTNIGTVSKATLGKLLRDWVERIWALPSAYVPSWTELNWWNARLAAEFPWFWSDTDASCLQVKLTSTGFLASNRSLANWSRTICACLVRSGSLDTRYLP